MARIKQIFDYRVRVDRPAGDDQFFDWLSDNDLGIGTTITHNRKERTKRFGYERGDGVVVRLDFRFWPKDATPGMEWAELLTSDKALAESFQSRQWITVPRG